MFVVLIKLCTVVLKKLASNITVFCGFYFIAVFAANPFTSTNLTLSCTSFDCRFGTHVCGAPPVTRHMKIINSGPVGR